MAQTEESIRESIARYDKMIADSTIDYQKIEDKINMLIANDGYRACDNRILNLKESKYNIQSNINHMIEYRNALEEGLENFDGRVNE